MHLDLTSLIVMDVHAHLSKTEVIGLLGGLYDNKKKVLEILRTEPCDSLSTGLQCEMDPGQNYVKLCVKYAKLRYLKVT